MSMTVEEAIRVLVALRDWDGELRIEIEDGYVPIKAIAKSWNSTAIVVPDDPVYSADAVERAKDETRKETKGDGP